MNHLFNKFLKQSKESHSWSAGLSGRAAEQLILGNFITLDENRPTAKAMTVLDGRIQYIGTIEKAMKLCNDATLVMDYGENSIYPGFMEAHCHPIPAGERLIGAADLNPGQTIAEYLEIMRKYMEKYPDREFYKGAGWKERDVLPTAQMLDEICSDKPMLLNSFDGHSIWVNSLVLEKEGITAEKAQEVGTNQIRVDESGNPTGYISESIAIKIYSKYQANLAERKEQMLAWQNFAFSQGYTAVGDTGISLGMMDTYDQVMHDPEWKLRTYGHYYLHEDFPNIDEHIQNAVQIRAEKSTEYFTMNGMKVFVDGVVEGHTAWLTDEYNDQPGEHGVKRYCDHERLVQVIKASSENDLCVHIHAIGDAAICCAVDAIEEAQFATGNYDQRNAIAHLQVVREEDIRRIADNHIIAVVAPLWAPKISPFWEQEVSALGKERAENAYPLKSFRNNGGTIAFHTDYPVSSQMNIPKCIYEALTRGVFGAGEESIRKSDEALERRETLMALTYNVAYGWHQEHRMGTLEVGKLANLSIYDVDFMNDELEKIPNAKHIATVVDGREVYSGK